MNFDTEHGIEKGLIEIGAHMTKIKVSKNEIRATFVREDIAVGFDKKGLYVSTRNGTYYPIIGYDCKNVSLSKQGLKMGDVEVIIQL